MNFTIFLFLGIIVFGIIWLATKFLGKNSLFIILTLFSILNCVLGSSISIFLTANICIGLIFFVAVIFTIYLIYKKFGLGDLIKAIIIYIAIVLIHSLIYFIIYLYMGGVYPEYYTFALAFNQFIVPFLIFLLCAVAFLAIVFLFKNIKFFGKFNDSFKWFLIIGSALFVSNLISISITEAIVRLPFGQIILDVFMSYLFAIIILGLLFLLEKFVLKFDQNSNFEEKIQSKIVDTYLKTKNAIKSTIKTTETEDETSEIIIEEDVKDKDK